MANWYGQARTNYFRVKDADAFRAWADKFDLEVIQRGDAFAVLPSPDSDSGDFDLIDTTTEGFDSLDIADELAAHVADDDVAIVMCVGHEKACYLTGWAVAVCRGEVIRVSIDDIYKKALTKFGIPPTEAEY